MGVFSRLNEQQKKQTEAENAMPGAYENRYDESIQNALENMNRQNTAGTGFDGSNVDYRGALSRLFGNAGASADAAAQTANQLSGGYGASWAQSAADQSAASRAQAGAPGALAKARADALTRWQQELAGQSSQLDSLLGQDQLERGEYDGGVANAQDWRNYQYGRTEQARTEKNNLLSNVWNAVQMVGSAVLQGYDAYKGYRQQDWENAFAERQYSDNLSRTELSDQVAALQQATAYKQAGFDDAAKAVLTKYGLDETMLDTWQGMSSVQQDQMAALLQGASLAGSGNDTAAKNYLQMADVDTGSIDYSPTLNQRQLNYTANQLELNNRYRTTGSGSRRTGSTKSGNTSSGSGKTGTTGFTNSQLQTMATKFSGMKKTDPLYDFYQKTLTDAGWLKNSTAGSNGTSGRANTRSSPLRSGLATARGMQARGYSLDDIAGRLSADGITDNTLSSIMKILEAER